MRNLLHQITPKNIKEFLECKASSISFIFMNYSWCLRKGVLSGESAIREVSAYLLGKACIDNNIIYLDTKGFSGVPYTSFVEIVHPYFSNSNNFKKLFLSFFFVKSKSCRFFFKQHVFTWVKICTGDMKDIEITKTKQNPMIPIQNYSQYTDQDKKLLIKHGSLQKFVDSAEEAGDYSYKLFPDSYCEITFLDC